VMRKFVTLVTEDLNDLQMYAQNPAYFVAMKVTLDVFMQWPGGIPLDKAYCKKIAAEVAPRSHQVDVGLRNNKVVWAEVNTDGSASDVKIIETIKVGPRVTKSGLDLGMW